MTGPENYEEAERLTKADTRCECPRTDCEHEAAMLRRAQVHATLALAAATADPFGHEGAWEQVLR